MDKNFSGTRLYDHDNSNDRYATTNQFTATKTEIDGILRREIHTVKDKTEIPKKTNDKQSDDSVLGSQKLILEHTVSQPVVQNYGLEIKTEQDQSVLIIRTYFVKKIIYNLQKIQDYAQEPKASMYVSEIIKASKFLFEKNSSDPFIQIVMALHDALLGDSNWTQYSAHQFELACEIIKRSAQDRKLNQKKVEKFVIELSDVGFDILPFNLLDFD
jgi:hypothetical protein